MSLIIFVIQINIIYTFIESTNEKFDEIVIQVPNKDIIINAVPKLIRCQKQGSSLLISAVPESIVPDLQLALKVNGYLSPRIDTLNGDTVSITCTAPSYEIGSVAKLNLQPKPVANVWKLEDTVEDDLIDEDNLLDEEDLQKPDPSSLRGIYLRAYLLVVVSYLVNHL